MFAIAGKMRKKRKNKMKLFVICGHGAGDSGACGNGYQEQERVRVLGKRIKELGGNDVMLGDTSRNYYEDDGISSLDISKDCQIIELHMDSASSNARGAHVIIYGGLDADKYDTALATFLTGLFPGRANSIVGRNDLANPARATSKGYSYRLVECGFISNAEDVSIFNNNIDKIACGILGCFGIGTTTPVEQPTQPTPVDKATDQVFEIGSLARLRGLFKVDQVLVGMDSIWSCELTGDGGNSVQASPLIKCDANGNATTNQVFSVGDYFYCNEKFEVLDVDAPTDAIKINVGGREIWVYAGPCDEVK